jgi:hypothetical protein
MNTYAAVNQLLMSTSTATLVNIYASCGSVQLSNWAHMLHEQQRSKHNLLHRESRPGGPLAKRQPSPGGLGIGLADGAPAPTMRHTLPRGGKFAGPRSGWASDRKVLHRTGR